MCKQDVGEIVIYDNFVRGTHENLAAALRDPRVKIFEAGGDITQTDILDAALEGADGVFQFAALWLLQCHEFPRTAFDVNVRGMFNVMDGLRPQWREAAGLVVVGLGLRRCGRRADDGGSSVQQQEFLWRDQDLRRGDGAGLSLPLRARLCRPALHERLRAAPGLSRAPISR